MQTGRIVNEIWFIFETITMESFHGTMRGNINISQPYMYEYLNVFQPSGLFTRVYKTTAFNILPLENYIFIVYNIYFVKKTSTRGLRSEEIGKLFVKH